VTSTDLVGHVCFAAIVQDLTGKVSTSGAPVCVDTVAPPFFYSCGVGAGGKPYGAGALIAAAMLVLLVMRRSRERASAGSRREGAG
jgi:MYXO-CTERM domain-containing protein